MVGIDLGVDTPTGLAADGFVYQTVDVLDADAVGDAVAAVVAVNGRLDDVVHAAGVAGGGPVHVLPDDEWDRVVGVNLKGTFVVARAALAKMVQQQRVDGERVHRDADVRFGDGHARFEGLREASRHEHKLPRFGRADEIASVAAFLLCRTPVSSVGRPSPSTVATRSDATTASPS